MTLGELMFTRSPKSHGGRGARLSGYVEGVALRLSDGRALASGDLVETGLGPRRLALPHIIPRRTAAFLERVGLAPGVRDVWAHLEAGTLQTVRGIGPAWERRITLVFTAPLAAGRGEILGALA